VKLVPGSIFARDFRIVSALAEGGMGAVYAVEQLSTGKRRALKVMQPQLIPDARARERFVLEARIGSQIESEHVVDVVASGIDEPTGMPWIAMELLEGVDLADHVKQRGQLPPQETYEVLSQLCDGLGAAHARGIVHRDLKPENVFISTSKRRGVPFIVKILDFGIAKVTHDNQTSATGTSAMGSPLWMAPEQTESGTRLRPATDVWALGLMAFWMLTGRSYWRAGNQAEIALTPVFTEVLVLPLDPPSVRAAQMGLAHLVPPAFDAWFFRCVARNHDQRFVDATQAIASLTPYFTLLEASSARRMIPPTVAMQSVPPPAMGSSPGVLSSAGAMTPLPQTTAQPAIEPPSAPHYLPHPTERTPGFVPPTVLGGSIPPGVPYTHHSPAYTATTPAPQSAYPPTQLSPAPIAPAAPLAQSTQPHGGASLPPHAMPMIHAAPLAVTAPMSGGTPMSGTPSIGGPTGAPYVAGAAPVAASRGSDGSVRWGVLGVFVALLVLATFVGLAFVVMLLRPGSDTPPPPTFAAPDAWFAPDAGLDAAPEPTDAGLDAPAARVRFATGGGTTTEEVTAPSGGGSDDDVFPSGTDRRFVGQWAGEGWRYRLMIDLAREGSSVRGAIRWTLAETPDEMYTARIGETATEYVSGTFSPPGLIALDGTSVTDDSLISTDHYDLHLAEDGSLVGVAREGGGRLSARSLD
jgi:serine/threonine protein kinase